MKLKITGVNMHKLHDDKHADFVIVSDASLQVKEDKVGWAAIVLNTEGAGNILYGLDNGCSDIQTAEFLPIIAAIHMLALHVKVEKKTKYKPRVHIITDSNNLVVQFDTISNSLHTLGQWKQFEIYRKTHFDISFSYRKRRSSAALSLVDTIASEMLDCHKNVEKTVTNIIKRYEKPLKGGE